MFHFYTDDQADFIRKNVKGRKSTELTEMFNERFGLGLKNSQIRAYMHNHGLSNGVSTKFKPGHVPANKGIKGSGGWEPTEFKKGHIPQNYKPVGSERVNGDGYIDIKIADPNKWKGKHILIWEKENGPVPKGYVVIFGDGDRHNFDINNLILASRRQLAILNHKGLIQKDADLTRTALIVTDR